MSRCLVCKGSSDGRSFCSPRHYLEYADGREARPGKGVAALGHNLEYDDDKWLAKAREAHDGGGK